MAFQFVHVSTYAKKCRSFKDKAGKQKTSKGGATTASVFGEAQRVPEYTAHVDTPKPPVLIYGQALAKTEAEHDEMAETLKDTQGRKIRSTQNTLLAGVASFPPDGKPEDFEKWKALTVDFLKSEYGDALKTVVEHVDEKERHIHFFALPDNLKAYDLHPGRQAKDAATKAGKPAKEANLAYKNAMRAYQNRYFEQVGIPAGLARLGPGRRRLSRDAWKTEQILMATIKKAVDVGMTAQAAAKQARAAADEAIKAQDAAETKARKASAWLKTVKGKAAAIMATAEDQAAKVKGAGGWLRSLFQGWAEASPEKLAEEIAVKKLEPLEVKLWTEKEEKARFRAERDKAQADLRETKAAAQRLKATVDRQAQELVRLSPPEPDQDRLPSPKPFIR